MKLCKCGCGLEIKEFDNRDRKVFYIRGHNKGYKKIVNQIVLCKCGCGKKLQRYDNRKREKFYIYGHCHRDIGLKMKEKFKDQNFRKKWLISNNNKIKKNHTNEEIEKIRVSSKRMWTVPENRKKISEKIRISTLNRISWQVNNGLPIHPCIGRKEKEILDDLEKYYNIKIIRQFPIAGYFIDGYIPELNLAIEYDEKHHDKKQDRDIMRQKEIEDILNCRFIRIKEGNNFSINTEE